MIIEVCGKAGCAICVAAKEKLSLMGLSFTESDLAAKIELHEGWRTDGTVAVMAGHADTNLGMPIILIDGEAFSYPDAMRKLRRGDA